MINLLAHTNNFDQMGQPKDFSWNMMDGLGMMNHWPFMGGGYLGGLFGTIIGVISILILIALLRWLWLKGNKEMTKKK